MASNNELETPPDLERANMTNLQGNILYLACNIYCDKPYCTATLCGSKFQICSANNDSKTEYTTWLITDPELAARLSKCTDENSAVEDLGDKGLEGWKAVAYGKGKDELSARRALRDSLDQFAIEEGRLFADVKGGSQGGITIPRGILRAFDVVVEIMKYGMR